MSISLTANAKLTLSLRIIGLRADGYHLIEAEMVTLDLFDHIEVDPDGSGVTIVDGDKRSRAERDNLVCRALAVCGRSAGAVVHKTIPAGAGLGGGSADAAAILRWCGFGDLLMASELGADVPFCVVGGRAKVTGIGEIVVPLDHEDRVFTLLTPPLHCSTPIVYRTWDEMGAPPGEHGNDLEPAALKAYPALARFRDELGDATGTRPRLAGSGSTWFVEGEYPGGGRVIARTTRSTDVGADWA